MLARMISAIALILLELFAGVGCAVQGAVIVTPAPSPTLAPIATPSPPQTPTLVSPATLNDFKYRLIAQFGKPFYCDPDAFPVARLITDDMIAQSIAELKKHPPEYETILHHLGLGTMTNPTIEQTRAIYAEAKTLNAITLKSVGNANEFTLRIGNEPQGEVISGVINSSGVITLTKRESVILDCPICLAKNTLIDTPHGNIPVQEVRPGMLVWTVDAAGVRRAVPVVATSQQPVPADFRIVRVLLEDGRQVFVSPNHPTREVRRIGELNPGDFLDGARVQAIALTLYADGWTYDILPASDTGTYWANGILLKSTLGR